MWSAIIDATMRPVVIVLLEIPTDVFSGLGQAAIFRRPDFFFLQATMEPFDVAVSFRMVVSRSSVRDAEPCQRLHKTCRSKLRAVAGGQARPPSPGDCDQLLTQFPSKSGKRRTIIR
jgi:hypothetical protein